MECRTLDLRIVSADDLKPVTLFHGMEVYVVVVHNDDLTFNNNRKQKTPVDKTGGNNPRWNFPIKLTLNEAALLGNRLTLKFQLFTRRKLLPDALVGEVHVPVLELVSSAGKAGANNVSYEVRKQAGKPIGVLNISYKFGDKFTTGVGTSMGYSMKPSHAHAHAGRYPAQPAQAGLGYEYPAQPAQAGLGYEYPAQTARLGHAHPAQMVHEYPAQAAGPGYATAYPPQHGGAGYTYPAQNAASGYAYPSQQVVQPQRRNNNLGMGLGAGLLGGALGGLVAGELVSDMGHNNDGYNDGGYDNNGYDGGYDDNGYDGGFDDGGFDF